MYQKIGFFILAALVSIILGVMLPINLIQWTLKYAGYYFIFGIVFLWCLLFFKQYSKKLLTFLRRHYAGLLLAFFIVTTIFVNSPPQFKVLGDESNLVGTSMSMYYDKIISLPEAGFFDDNLAYAQYTSRIDKRSLLFPFLTSVVHTLLGYSAENGFVVNFFASVGLLFLFYLFVERFFSGYYAIVSILLFASVPNFVIWSASSGMETLNVFFFVLTFYVFHQFLMKPDKDRAEFLFVTLVLLSICRYESFAVSCLVFCFVPFFLKRNVVEKFSLITLSIPFMFLPMIWQRMIFNDQPIIHGDLKHTTVQNVFEAYNLKYLILNSLSNVKVLLGLDPYYGFSLCLSVVAILGMFVGIGYILRNFRTMRRDVVCMVSLAGLTFIFEAVVISGYRWGDLSDATINRVAIIFIPYMSFLAVYAISIMTRHVGEFRKPALILVGVFHLFFMWPHGFAQQIIYQMDLPIEYKKVMTYITSEFKNESLLIVSDTPNLYVINKYSSVKHSYLDNERNRVSILQALGSQYDRVLVFQRYLRQGDIPLLGSKIKDKLRLKYVKSIPSTSLTYIKIFTLLKPQEITEGS